MKYYELMMVVSPRLDDEAVDATVGRVNDYVNNHGGNIIDQSRWGRLRKLAYPINNFREGNYILTHLEIEPDDTKDLESSLIISEDVLRHLLLSVDSIPEIPGETVDKAPAEVVDEAPAAEVVDEAPAAEVVDEAPAAEVVDEASAEVVDEAPAAEVVDEASAEVVDEASAEVVDEASAGQTDKENE